MLLNKMIDFKDLSCIKNKWYHNNELFTGCAENIIYNKIKLKHYFVNGKRHKEDGPAVEGEIPNLDYKIWWYNGIQIECNAQNEFEKLIKLQLFW